MSIRPLLALVAKDLRVFLSDRYALVLSFLAPVALASFMALIFGGAGPAPPSRIPIRLTDEDGSAIARRIVSGSAGDDRLLAVEQPRAEARSAVRTGDAVLSVVIPPGFGEAAANALYGDTEPPELLFLHDPMSQSDVSLARGLLTRVILEAVTAEALGPEDEQDGLMDLLSEELLNDDAPSSDDELQRAEFLSLFARDDSWWQSPAPEAEAGKAELVEAFPGIVDWFEPVPGPADDPATSAPEEDRGLTLPYATREETIAPGGSEGEQASLAAHAFAGMVVQFVLFSAVEWGVVLLQERQRGLWKRLRSAPVSRSTLMLSKILGCAIVSLAIILSVFAAGAVLFGYRIAGDPIAFAATAVVFALMASAFGLTVASLGRTPQGARSVALLGVLVMVMLGGCWIPSFLFPDWLQALTPAIPTRWAIDGFDGVFCRGFSLAETLPAILALSGFGAAFAAFSLLAFRWSEP
jgi:ABC-2 type transport system permease protein